MNVCLLYHGIHRRDHYAGVPGWRGLTGAGFARHIALLRRVFDIVPASEIFADDGEATRPGRRPRVAITFDDGFANFAEVAYPVIARHRVPVTLFVSTSFLDDGPPLWFMRTQVACLFGPATPLRVGDRDYDRSTGEARVRSLGELTNRIAAAPWARAAEVLDRLPDPRSLLPAEAAHDLVDGLTRDQLRRVAADPLVEIGSHTVHHPFLTRCSGDQLFDELEHSRAELEAILQRPVDQFAYPLGDYDPGVRDAVSQRYAQAWAVAPRMAVPDPVYEKERYGVYGASLTRLLVKASGVASWIRRAGRAIG